MTKTMEGCSRGVEQKRDNSALSSKQEKTKQESFHCIRKKTEHGNDSADTRGIMSAAISWMGTGAQKRSSNKEGLDNAIHMWRF